jgi:outer membrane protein OmpA-like peptidoglycan-associated protein
MTSRAKTSAPWITASIAAIVAVLAAGLADSCTARRPATGAPARADDARRLEERVESAGGATPAPPLDDAAAGQAAASGAAPQARKEPAPGAREGAAAARQALERAKEAEALGGGQRLQQPAEVVDDIHFTHGTAVLTSRSHTVLDRLAERLRSSGSGFFLEVQGHSDSTGSREENRRLAEARAEAVRRYLHFQGIPLQHIGVVALGESAPAADNRTADGRARNRRAVVVVLR